MWAFRNDRGAVKRLWALGQGLPISAMAGVIAPYPTRGEASKRAAGDYYTPTLFGPRTRKLVGFLSLFRH